MTENDKKTALIAKLLAQAEDPRTPGPEADLAMSHAQRLATSNGVSLAKARHFLKSKEKSTPIRKSIQIGVKGDRGRSTKVDLFLGIAQANDLRTSISKSRMWVYAHGYEEDIDVTVALYRSLLVQMAKASAEYKKSGGWRHEEIVTPDRYITKYTDYHGRPCRKIDHWDSEEVFVPGSRKPMPWLTARLSFQIGYASQIAHRLAMARYEEIAAQKSAETEAHDTTDPGTALVLAEKENAVEDFYYAQNPSFKKKNKRCYDGARDRKKNQASYRARSAGSDAADNAKLGDDTSLPGARKAIGA